MSHEAEIGDFEAVKLGARVLHGPVALLAMFHELRYPDQYPEDFSDVIDQPDSLTVVGNINELPVFEAALRIRSVALPVMDKLHISQPDQPPYRRMLGYLTLALIDDGIDQFEDNSGMPLMPDAILPPEEIVESMDRQWGDFRLTQCLELEEFITELRRPKLTACDVSYSSTGQHGTESATVLAQ